MFVRYELPPHVPVQGYESVVTPINCTASLGAVEQIPHVFAIMEVTLS